LIIVASANGAVGMDAAWALLAAGGSALDAVEAATREVESNPDDHSVGYGGYPNFDGVVELDASIMDGTTRAAGAVAALRRNRHAITVARAVMEQSPHVLVVGEGADRLAEAIGLAEENLLTPEAEQVWRAGLGGDLADRLEAADPVGTEMLGRVRALATDPDRAAGTVNFLTIDGAGRMASAVSTSGWAWKFPGRAGDSPIIGAGNYCDGRFAAAACTGHGELALRASTARSIVAAHAAGATLEQACVDQVRELFAFGQRPVVMHAVALSRTGHHCGVTTRPGATYVFRADGMRAHEEVARLVVEGDL
jgi:beta-aspartyl-peptidase (threonine type)